MVMETEPDAAVQMSMFENPAEEVKR